jgi:hypothetical protein
MKAARWLLVTTAAIGAAGSAYVWQSDRTTAAAPAAVQNLPQVERAAGSSLEALGKLDRSPLSSRMQQDPFMTDLSRPKPATTLVAIAPARPALPAFPYKYAGTLKNNGVTEAFLLRGADLVPIKAGEVLDGAWRIESLTGDRLEVTFVPAGERVALLLASLVAEPGIPAAGSTPITSVAAYGETSAGPTTAGPSPLVARGDGMPYSSISGGAAVTPAAGPASAGSRAMASASSAAASTSTPSRAASVALGSEAPVRTTRLGSEAPAQGSMPLGSAPGGSFPKGGTPTGQLGL